MYFLYDIGMFKNARIPCFRGKLISCFKNNLHGNRFSLVRCRSYIEGEKYAIVLIIRSKSIRFT